MASLLDEHLKSVKPCPQPKEATLSFEDCGPDSESDSGLEDLWGPTR